MTDRRFLASVQRGDGCWEWMRARSRQGYGVLAGTPKAGRWFAQAHRVSYELFCGPIPVDMQVLHRCDNPPCVRPDHLFLGTQADNMADKAAKGRAACGDQNGARLHPESRRGERNGRAKLVAADVLAIRAATHRRGSDLARQYGVSGAKISQIRLRQCWTHI